MTVPTWAVPVLTLFRPAFSPLTYHRFLVLALVAVLTTGRRTVTNLLRNVRVQAPGPASSDHRQLAKAVQPCMTHFSVSTIMLSSRHFLSWSCDMTFLL
jgi:hypothetical protein